MKRFYLLIVAAALAAGCANDPVLNPIVEPYEPVPEKVKMKYSEASGYTVVGKLIDTPNPYHRVDTVVYKGFNETENRKVRMSSGLAIAFKTDSRVIDVWPSYSFYEWRPSSAVSSCGYSLFIKKDGQWIYAASGVPGTKENPNRKCTLISNMTSEEKECLLYLPLYSSLDSLKIGVENGASIEAIPNPFRHRIAVFGSSFTHGAGTSISAMPYPAQLSRMTGLGFLSLGCGAVCRLQDYFADVLCDADVDAFLFDSFSNPSVDQVKERLFPFIEEIQAAHPGKPLIFQRTIYREKSNFDMSKASSEAERLAVVDSMMAIACKTYPDVYYITPKANAPGRDATSDGTHPDDYGYALWAQSIRKPVTRILKKYGIK